MQQFLRGGRELGFKQLVKVFSFARVRDFDLDSGYMCTYNQVMHNLIKKYSEEFNEDLKSDLMANVWKSNDFTQAFLWVIMRNLMYLKRGRGNVLFYNQLIEVASVILQCERPYLADGEVEPTDIFENYFIVCLKFYSEQFTAESKAAFLEEGSPCSVLTRVIIDGSETFEPSAILLSNPSFGKIYKTPGFSVTEVSAVASNSASDGLTDSSSGFLKSTVSRRERAAFISAKNPKKRVHGVEYTISTTPLSASDKYTKYIAHEREKKILEKDLSCKL